MKALRGANSKVSVELLDDGWVEFSSGNNSNKRRSSYRDWGGVARPIAPEHRKRRQRLPHRRWRCRTLDPIDQPMTDDNSRPRALTVTTPFRRRADDEPPPPERTPSRSYCRTKRP